MQAGKVRPVWGQVVESGYCEEAEYALGGYRTAIQAKLRDTLRA